MASEVGRDEKDGANTEPSGEVASRGRGNFRATARKLSVTESLRLRNDSQKQLGVVCASYHFERREIRKPEPGRRGRAGAT